LKDALKEAGEVKQQSLAVKEELTAAQGALASFREVLETARQLRQELDAAAKEHAEVRERSQAVRQELLATEGSLGGVRQTLDTMRDDLKGQFREAGARFLTNGEASSDLQRELRELQSRMAAVHPRVEETLVVATPPAQAEAAVVVESQAVVAEPPEQVAVTAQDGAMAAVTTNGAATEEGKPQLGITVSRDARVVDVLPETPAEKAGIQRGDVVLDVDGKPVASSEDLREAIAHAEPGKEVHLVVARGPEKEEVKAQLAETPAS